MPRVRPFAAALVAAALSTGCLSFKPQAAYEGPARSRDEVAMVVVPRHVELGSVTEILIDEIDGAGGAGEWTSGENRVLLLPGVHDLRVRRRVTLTTQGLIQLAVNAFEASKSKKLARTVRLDVASGRVYFLHFTGPPAKYFVSWATPITDGAEAAMDPPWDAGECVPENSDPDADPEVILTCPGPSS